MSNGYEGKRCNYYNYNYIYLYLILNATMGTR
jgi:hypothetical protein